MSSTLRDLHHFFEAIHSDMENLWSKTFCKKTGAKDKGFQESQSYSILGSNFNTWP